MISLIIRSSYFTKLLKQELESPSEGFIESVKESIEDEVSLANNPTERGHRFLKWVLTRIFDISEEELQGQITDGSNDMGIDVWALIETEGDGKTSGIIQLFQLKYGKSYDIDKEIVNFQEEINSFLKVKTEHIQRDDLKELHFKIKTQNLQPELYFITNQRVNYDKKGKVKVFGIDQIVKTLWDEIVGLPKNKVEKIKLESSLLYGKNAIIGVMPLSELVKFVNKTRSYIFESNIRKYLRRTKVNTGLIETLENDSENVFYYNNGITIVVRDFKINNGMIELLEPQIVNGAQTSTIIAEKLSYRENTKGSIQVTIVRETNKTTREEITRCRNSQNAVKGKDLISLKHFHTKIRGQLNNFGYYYETQAGNWINMDKQQKLSFKGHHVFNEYLPKKHSHYIPAKDAIQTMVAGIFQDPTRPYSSIASFMPSGTYYNKIFDEKLKDDYRLLFYPYLIKCYSEVLGYGSPESDPEPKRYARLLFVASYFKILFEKIIKENKDEIIKNPSILDKYFEKVEANKELLNFIDEDLKHYFIRGEGYLEDNKIPTWHNFFSKYAWDKPLQQVIESFVKMNDKKLTEITKKF